MILTPAARKRSCPKCSRYSTAFPIESARMSVPSREERSKYASVADALARRKRVKLRSTQSRFSERYLHSVITANHAFLLVAIDVPDHSLHVSNSCSFRNTQPPFPFARSENDPSTFAQAAPAPTTRRFTLPRSHRLLPKLRFLHPRWLPLCPRPQAAH